MKKIIFIITNFIIIQTYAQCNIITSNVTPEREEISFTVDTKAQCDDCYLWTASNLQILGSNKQNKVTIKATDTDNKEISVLLLTSDGTKECKKIVEANTSEKSIAQATKCGISIKDFKEVKVDNSTMSFFPSENRSDYSYRWIVTYKNGDRKESTEKIPQFSISKENNIVTTKLQIISKSPICSSTISKDYQDAFWSPKEEYKVEQKSYSQSDYIEHTKSTKADVK